MPRFSESDVSGALCCFGLPLLVFVILVGLALDDGASWIAAFIPLWIPVAAALFLSVALACSRGNEAWGAPALVGGMSLAAFSVLLPLKLDAVVATSWYWVMAPLWLLLALPGATQVLSLEALQSAAGGAWGAWQRLAAGADVVALLLGAQTLVLALQAEGTVEWTWPWLCAPLWVFDAVLVASTLGECQPRRTGDAGSTSMRVLLMLSCAVCATVQGLVAAKALAGLDASYFVTVSVPTLVWLLCASCAAIAFVRS